MLCRQVTNNETKWEVHSFFFFPDDQKIEKSWAWQTYIWMYCNFEIYSEKYWLLILSRLTNNGTKSTCFVFFPDEPKKKRWIGMYCTWDVIHCLADAEIGMLRIQKIETPAKIIYPEYYKNSNESFTFVLLAYWTRQSITAILLPKVLGIFSMFSWAKQIFLCQSISILFIVLEVNNFGHSLKLNPEAV